MEYIGCIWTRVVVKAETISANHSNFSTNRSNTTILFTIQLSDKFLICSYDFIVAKELNMPRYRRQKRHCRCVGALKLARARPFGSFKTIRNCRFYKYAFIRKVKDDKYLAKMTASVSPNPGTCPSIKLCLVEQGPFC